MRKERLLNYTWVFMLPVVILAAIYFSLNILPFGDTTLLTADLDRQYVSYFSYLRNSLLGNDSLLYSFSKTMSGEMISLTAYYLLSPFNFVFLFFDTADFPLAVTLITLLKTGSAGLTMSFYLRQKNRSYTALLLLSTTYALSGYSLVYQQNIMWLDALILFPLVIYGIDNIVYGKKVNISYAIFLFLMLFTNFYIGYMICIFAVIYFVSCLVAQVIDEWGTSFLAELKKIGKQTLHFTIQSLVAGGLAAFLLVPTYFSLQTGDSSVALSNLLGEFSINFSIVDFLSKFVLGAFSYYEMTEGLPNVFVSFFVVILVLLFVFNPKIKSSTKVKYILLLGSLYLSFAVNAFDLIWHGTNPPTWFPYRYSFMFSFVLIVIASIQIKSKYFSKKVLVSSSLFILLILSLISNNDYAYLETHKIQLTALIAVLWTVMLFFLSHKNRKWIALLSTGLLAVELGFNGYWSLKTNDYTDNETFSQFVTQNQNIVNDYKRTGDEFYRIDKNYMYNRNDPLLLGYEGLSHFSTTSNRDAKNFMGHMGYRNNGNWARFSYGSSVPADSFMGLRYLISDFPLSYYPLVEERNGKYIYENPYYFPLGFYTEQDVSGTLDQSHPFAYQNDLFNTVFGVDEVFQPMDPENIQRSTENLRAVEDSDHQYHYEKIDESQDAFVYYEFSNINSDYINFYFLNDHSQGVEIYADGDFIGEALNIYNHTVNVVRPDSDNLTIALKLKGNDVHFNEDLFYSSNDEDLTELKNRVDENGLNINQFEPTYIQGTVNNNEERTLMLTVPYDPSWQVTVDGENAQTFPVFDALMGIQLPANSENVELRFVPTGLRSGIILSIGSVIVLIGYYWLLRKDE